MDTLRNYEKTLDRTLAHYPVALQLERQTGINKAHLVFLGLLGFVLLILFRLFTTSFVALALFVWPALASLRSIERHDKAADVHCLTYWLAIATLLTLESIVGLDRLQSRLPLYNLGKVALAVWMYAPRTRGSLIVYERVLRPALLQLDGLTASFKVPQTAAPAAAPRPQPAPARSSSNSSVNNNAAPKAN